MDIYASTYNPTICVTHQCNLSCVYCYQHNHESLEITEEIAKNAIDDIMKNIPKQVSRVCISFIGGEPLLKHDLLVILYEYIFKKYCDDRITLFATTNGTLLSDEMKAWFYQHRDKFILGISLDGAKQSHDFNRSNSFDKIDIPFFVNTWPDQGPKMTISQKSLESLADDVIFLHHQGFKYINGVNLAEGDFDWSDRKLLRILATQLSKLVEFYIQNPQLNLDQLMARHIEYCASPQKERKKVCGIGSNTIFYDIDGKKYPCSYVTPMTFSSEELANICQTDFSDSSLFIDEECLKNCYLYPICSSCSGANYSVNHTFSQRIKSKCNLTKIIALYIAEFHAEKILQGQTTYDETQQFFLIEAIKEIKSRYFEEFRDFLEE